MWRLCDAFLDMVSYCCFVRGKLRYFQARNSNLVQEEKKWEDVVQGFEQADVRPRIAVKQEITSVEEEKTNEEYWREYFAAPTDW
jgi:hypothetical protein